MRAKIEKLVYGGEGLAHENGETLFVPFVLPGEEAEVDIVERKKKLLRGRATQLLQQSPQRIEARCPHFGVCGGCDYQHMAYEAQIAAKEEILRETLRRIGRVDWRGPIAVHRSPPWEYRNRAQWKVRAPGHTSERECADIASIGYVRARSSAFCGIETCSIVSPRLIATFQALRGALANGGLPSSLREIEAFANAEDEEILLTATCSSLPRAAEQLLQSFAQLLPFAKSILLQDMTGDRMALRGPGFLQYDIMQKSFRVGHLSFFQVNRFLVGEMARAVGELAGSGELAFDLYAGVGLFCAFLAGSFSQVHAVEADPASARDLEGLAHSGTKRIAVHNQAASHFLREWKTKRNGGSVDAAIVDPPRAGLENGVAEQLTAISPRRIIYVSCDPSTLARDLARLDSAAYTVIELHLFDMFPETYHIESVVLLERRR